MPQKKRDVVSEYGIHAQMHSKTNVQFSYFTFFILSIIEVHKPFYAG